jgi:phage-related minor tail protein/transposase
VASYNANINIAVSGQDRLKYVLNSVEKLNALTAKLKPINLLAPGAGAGGDAIRVAKKQLDDFARAIVNFKPEGINKRARELSNTLAGASDQASALTTALANVGLKSGGFKQQAVEVRNYALALDTAARNAARLDVISAAVQRGARVQNIATRFNVSTQQVEQRVANIREAAAKRQAQLDAAERQRDLQKILLLKREEDFEIRLGRIRERNAQREENRVKARRKAENVAIGGAFPLLFGGGPGAVLGGAAGGFIPGNPILSVVTSALGMQLDTLIQSTVDFSKSLREGGDAAGFLEQKLGFLDPTIKKQIQNLQNSGQTAEAAKVAFNKLASEIGTEGAAGFLQAGKNAENLQNSFTKLTLSIVAAGFAFNKFLEDQKGFKFDVNTLPEPFRPTQIPEDAATTAAYKQKTKEIQNQNTLLGLQATLKGIDSKIDLDSYAAIRRKVAQQEYSNELLKIGNQLKLGEIGLDQNQLLIRSANLELAGKIKDIELDRARQLAQNNEQAAQKAKQAADEESRVLKSVASIRKDIVSTTLDGVNAQFELDTLYKGEYAVLKDRIKNAQNELDTKSLILDLEEEAALASATDKREQDAIVELFKRKAQLLALQATIQNKMNIDKALELKYTKDIADIQSKGNLKVAGSQAAADIAGARGNLARSLGGTGFEFQQQQLNAQQQAQRDALATRLQEINRLEQDIPNLTGSKLTDSQKVLSDKQAQYAIDLQRLDTLSAIEQQQLRVNQVTEQYGGIANSIGTAFSTSFKGIINGTMTAQEALAGFFQSVADAFLDMAAQIIAKWIQMTILNSILSLFPGGGGLAKSGGSGFDMGGINNTGLGTFKASNSFANLGMRAAGGPVAGGTPYIVGEKGPELFMPGRSGTVIPNDALGGGGGVQVGAINISVQNSGENLSASAQKQIAGQVQSIVLSTLVDQRRSGGVLTR